MSTVDVCALDDLTSGTATKFDVSGFAISLVRIDDDVYAIGDVCSHANVSLSEGEVWCEEREIECPKHGSLFSLTSGEALTLPATQPVPVFEVTVLDGRVHVAVTLTTIDSEVAS
jgi:3-phenylpropionate/trans-cinnamate dioxygenase ferredoxin component